MAKSSKSSTSGTARSAVSGRFVSSRYAKQNPRTTIVHKKKS